MTSEIVSKVHPNQYVEGQCYITEVCINTDRQGLTNFTSKMMTRLGNRIVIIVVNKMIRENSFFDQHVQITEFINTEAYMKRIFEKVMSVITNAKEMFEHDKTIEHTSENMIICSFIDNFYT